MSNPRPPRVSLTRRFIDKATERLGVGAVRRYERLSAQRRHDEAQAWAEGLLNGLTGTPIAVPSTKESGL